MEWLRVIAGGSGGGWRGVGGTRGEIDLWWMVFWRMMDLWRMVFWFVMVRRRCGWL